MILFYCGVNIIEYNPLNRAYKTVMKVERLLLISMFQDQLSGRNFVGVLSRSRNNERKQHRIEIYDRHLRQVVWTTGIVLNGWEPVKLFVNYSRRKVLRNLYSTLW